MIDTVWSAGRGYQPRRNLLRTNKRFTLKTRRMTRAHLDDFVACYRPGVRPAREATWSEQNPQGRWRPYSYDEIVSRDKVSLDLFWLRDESVEDVADLENARGGSSDGRR